MTSMVAKRVRRVGLSLLWILLALILVLVGLFFYVDFDLYMHPLPTDLDSAIQQQMEAAKLPSVTVAVFKENQILFAKGYGFANLEEERPATADTIYQIASVSKLATATAVMRLYDQGGFQLDDDINQYLDFSVRNPHFPDTPITFRMLLAHTASIADGPAYEASYTLGKAEDPTVSLAEFMRDYFMSEGRYYDGARNFTKMEPGTHYAYSNIAFGLLGYLVERISGQPFDEYCQQQLFVPLGMSSTHWFNHQVDKRQMAMPYGYNLLQQAYVPLGYYGFATYPDGLLKSSAHDFVRLLLLYINQGQLPNGQPFLRPETVEEMLRTQYPESGGDGVGLAWHTNQNRQMIYHDGGDPGVSTLVAVSPEKQWGFVIFANSGGMENLRGSVGFELLANNLYPRLAEYAEQHEAS